MGTAICKRWLKRCLVGGMLLSSLAAGAEELRLYAAGAAKAAVERLTADFERQTGHTLRTSVDTVGALRDRVLQGAAGATADVVILSHAALAPLAQAGRLQPDSQREIGAVAVALAVPQAAAIPDISTPAALRQALLAAPTLAYADPARGATAGTHFDRVLQQLGVRAQLQDRITLLPFGMEVIEAVAQGRFSLGVSQSSEILQHAGVALVGPLPAPYDRLTPYAAAQASARPAARQLLEFLSRPESLRHFRDTGFLPP